MTLPFGITGSRALPQFWVLHVRTRDRCKDIDPKNKNVKNEYFIYENNKNNVKNIK